LPRPRKGGQVGKGGGRLSSWPAFSGGWMGDFILRRVEKEVASALRKKKGYLCPTGSPIFYGAEPEKIKHSLFHRREKGHMKTGAERGGKKKKKGGLAGLTVHSMEGSSWKNSRGLISHRRGDLQHRKEKRTPQKKSLKEYGFSCRPRGGFFFFWVFVCFSGGCFSFLKKSPHALDWTGKSASSREDKTFGGG